MVNPRILEVDGKQVEEEGCLSVPGFQEFLERPSRAVLSALDLEGKEFTMEGTELLARAFCHETDHLDGKLFLDRLGGIKRQLLLKRVQRAGRDGDWDEIYP